MEFDNDIQLYFDLPRLLHQAQCDIICSGFIANDKSYSKAELLVNGKSSGVTIPSPHLNPTSKKLNKNGFIIYHNQTLEQEGQFTYELILENERGIERYSLGTALFKKPKLFDFSKEVVICLPTYNPKIELFKKQLHSILNQSFTNFQIFIQDDGSEQNILAEIEKVIKGNDQIIFTKNETNLGFYNNIESMLAKIGVGPTYIAFSDQDDIWETNKIESQLKAIKETNSDMVYSDLKILNSEESIISSTFWNKRSNHINNQQALLVNNVATGSTIMFSTQLLNEILPFPQEIPRVFHDHWICYLLKNNHQVNYIDQQLVHYIQHDSNVTGFIGFKKPTLALRLATLFSLLLSCLFILIKKDLAVRSKFIVHNQRVYHKNFQRYKQFISRTKNRSITEYSKLSFELFSIVKLLFLSIKTLFKKIYLNRTEVAIYTSIIVMITLKFRSKIRS